MEKINYKNGSLYCSVNCNPSDYSQLYSSSEECIADLIDDITEDCQSQNYSDSELQAVIDHYDIVFNMWSGNWGG